MEWTVMKGTVADAAVIAGFQIKMAMESEGASLDMERVLKGVTHGIEDPSKGSYFIVKNADGMICGSLLVTKEWSDWNDCWYWWIQSVYVQPDCRRKGAFKAMYEAVRALAFDEGCPCIRLYVDKENVSAQECYNRRGMHECHYLMYEEVIQSPLA